MNKKKVSVIVAAYNVEKTISQAVQSLLEQTYDNIEIIIVNDGSTDRSQEIIDDYVEQA